MSLALNQKPLRIVLARGWAQLVPAKALERKRSEMKLALAKVQLGQSLLWELLAPKNVLQKQAKVPAKKPLVMNLALGQVHLKKSPPQGFRVRLAEVLA